METPKKKSSEKFVKDIRKKKRLNGGVVREATSDEVSDLKKET
ncbi:MULTISPECIES: hypothetical protein [Chryseobacterium]